jgi:hypothetical protein
VISVVVLQNGMNLRKGERGSCSDTCVISTVDGNRVNGIEAETVSSVTEEGQKSMTITEIKTEPSVSVVPFKGFITCVYVLCFCAAACCSGNMYIFSYLNIYLLNRSPYNGLMKIVVCMIRPRKLTSSA